jgi:hypothetical protein
MRTWKHTVALACWVAFGVLMVVEFLVYLAASADHKIAPTSGVVLLAILVAGFVGWAWWYE